MKLKDFFHQKARKIVADRIKNGTPLTRKHLINNGWVKVEENDHCWFIEPDVKERDKVWVKFEGNHYAVHHGRLKAFVAIASTIEWLETYMALVSDDIALTKKDILKR